MIGKNELKTRTYKRFTASLVALLCTVGVCGTGVAPVSVSADFEYLYGDSDTVADTDIDTQNEGDVEDTSETDVEGSTEETEPTEAEEVTAKVKQGALFVGDKAVVSKSELEQFVADEFEKCLEAVREGYEDIEPSKGKEAFVTVEHYGGIIYAIQNGFRNVAKPEILGYELDTKDLNTQNWLSNTYYACLMDAVEAASAEYSYDIYTSNTQAKDMKLSEYEVGKDTAYTYSHTIHPILGRVNIESEYTGIEEIMFSATGSDYAFTVDVDYTSDVVDINGNGVYREVTQGDDLGIEVKAVNVGGIDYAPKVAVESFAVVYHMSLGELTESELAIGLDNKKMYSVSSVIRSDGTYNRSVEEIGEISEVQLTPDDIKLTVQDSKIIAIVTKYSEVLDGVLVGRTFTLDELYENAPTGYIPELKAFCMRSNVYTVEGMKDVLLYVTENNITDKGLIRDALEKADKGMYNQALKDLGMQSKTPLVVGIIAIVVIIGGIVLGVMHHKKKKVLAAEAEEREAKELAELKAKFNKRNKEKKAQETDNDNSLGNISKAEALVTYTPVEADIKPLEAEQEQAQEHEQKTTDEKAEVVENEVADKTEEPVEQSVIEETVVDDKAGDVVTDTQAQVEEAEDDTDLDDIEVLEEVSGGTDDTDIAIIDDGNGIDEEMSGEILEILDFDDDISINEAVTGNKTDNAVAESKRADSVVIKPTANRKRKKIVPVRKDNDNNA